METFDAPFFAFLTWWGAGFSFHVAVYAVLVVLSPRQVEDILKS